jgi:hypothetical protein
MASGDKSAKVIPFPGPGKSVRDAPRHRSAGAETSSAPENRTCPPGAAGALHATKGRGIPRLLEALHPAIVAVLVARERTWELFERQNDDNESVGILDRIPLTDLLGILGKSAANAMAAQRAATPPVLQAPDTMKLHPAAHSDRITLSPWQAFDIALLLREGKPRFALLLEPGTSIYVAEESLPMVAAFFEADKAHS